MFELQIEREGYITDFNLVGHMMNHKRFPALSSQYIQWDENVKQYRILQPLPDLLDWWALVLEYLAFPVSHLKTKLREQMQQVVFATLYPVAIDNPRYPHVCALERINHSIDLVIEGLETSEKPETVVSLYPEKSANYMSTAYWQMINIVRTMLSYIPSDSNLYQQMLDIKALLRSAYRYTQRLPCRNNWTKGERFPCI